MLFQFRIQLAEEAEFDNSGVGANYAEPAPIKRIDHISQSIENDTRTIFSLQGWMMQGLLYLRQN